MSEERTMETPAWKGNEACRHQRTTGFNWMKKKVALMIKSCSEELLTNGKMRYISYSVSVLSSQTNDAASVDMIITC